MRLPWFDRFRRPLRKAPPRRPAAARCRPRLHDLEDRTLLSTLTVSNAADAGPGSLRQAIADAGQGESVRFAAGVTGHTSTLVSGELLPRNGISVTGPGADLVTVSGAHSSRVSEIPAAATVTIAGLTITHGWADTSGGGILNHGTLTVSSCLLTGNDAKLFGGAIANPDGGITPPRYAATFSLSSRNKRRLASQKPW